MKEKLRLEAELADAQRENVVLWREVMEHGYSRGAGLTWDLAGLGQGGLETLARGQSVSSDVAA